MARTKWAILLALVIMVSMVNISSPVTACWTQITSCEDDSVQQGDGGATNYWYDDLYPPNHYLDPGTSTEWIINVWGNYGCSDYEHVIITDDTPPSGWTTTIEMGTIYSGPFHYIEAGNPAVNEGDNIEGREFYVGYGWEFDIIYRVTAPSDASGGEYANMTCTVYVVGYLPENQHDYVYVHCNAGIAADQPPSVVLTMPNGGESLSGTETITWSASSPSGDPLSFDIFLSDDGGGTFPYTLVTGLGDAVRSWDWDTTTYSDDIDYRVKIVVTDGSQYGDDISNSDFSLDNYVPEFPTNLKIHFGLTTNGEPTNKGGADDTGSALERIQKDDSRGYAVQKGETLFMETFNTGIQTAPVESAILHAEYWVESEDYSGTDSILWKLESESTWHDTGITPLSTDICSVVKSFDLFAHGVDTLDEIANLDISFFNSDTGGGQSVHFDYIWVTIKASTNDVGLTWESSTSLDIDHYHVYRSTDGVTFSKVKCSYLEYWNDAGKAVDTNNYFYKVKTKDTGGKEGPATYVVAKHVSSVELGWNMVSTPLIHQHGGYLDDAFYSINDNFYSVQSYHAGFSRPWTHWHHSKPHQFNSLTNIDHFSGYYVDMKTSQDFITMGRLPGSEPIHLRAGWNLIGYPKLSAQPRDDALSSISDEMDAVYGLDPATQREMEVKASDNMIPGNAYWIHVSHDCDLTL
jgi:hypothetical protein